MNKLDLWHLCDELSVPDASLLILGFDPEDQNFLGENLADQPTGYKAVSTAIKNAIQSQILEAKISYIQDDSSLQRYLSWESTKICVIDLKAWLLEKNFTNTFSFKKIQIRLRAT